MLEIKELGKRIRDLRLKAGLSQQVVARSLNTSQNIISRMEKGDGASMEMFLSVVSFYQEIFKIDNLLSDDFDATAVWSRDGQDVRTHVKDRLNELKAELTTEIEKLIQLIQVY